MQNHILYRPLTAAPFKKNIFYREIAPCRELQAYVRCFWGSEQPAVREAEENAAEIVIPDTCADIIYYIDYTDNTVSGGFCGVNDRSFYAHEAGKRGHLTGMFAIRFYAWTACAFAEDSLKATLNQYLEVGSRFEWLDRLIRPVLPELKTIQERASFVEKLFIQRLADVRENEVVNGAVRNILMNRGTMDVSGLAREAFISARQLERLFHEYVGITPKKLSNLIRYQLLWRDVLFEPDFDVLNAVCKYGYTDQAHLLHEFKRYHSMDINSAKTAAFCRLGVGGTVCADAKGGCL